MLSAAQYEALAKKRLDVLLVERGLAESRAQAQALVLAGLVPGYEKAGAAGRRVGRAHGHRAAAVRLARRREARARARRVRRRPGRARLPRRRRLDRRLHRRACSSAGAARVIALDVGYGQLHPRLRGDPRVTVLERTNARDADASCRSRPSSSPATSRSSASRTALPPALALAAPGWEALVLVKPQFEAGRGRGARAGSSATRRSGARVLREVAEAALAWEAQAVGVVDSGLPGPKGNREFFLHLVHRERAGDSR